MTDTLPRDAIAPKDAARLCGVHVSTVIRWIHGGRIPGYSRAGTRYLVSRADALAVVRRVEPARPAALTDAGLAHQSAAAAGRLAELGVR